MVFEILFFSVRFLTIWILAPESQIFVVTRNMVFKILFFSVRFLTILILATESPIFMVTQNMTPKRSLFSVRFQTIWILALKSPIFVKAEIMVIECRSKTSTKTKIQSSLYFLLFRTSSLNSSLLYMPLT